MTMKKTDLYKNLGKQIERQAKSAGRPDRFGAGAAKLDKREKALATPSKLVPVTCRLPADLAARLRAHALDAEGGVSAIVEAALVRWLDAQAPEA